VHFLMMSSVQDDHAACSEVNCSRWLQVDWDRLCSYIDYIGRGMYSRASMAVLRMERQVFASLEWAEQITKLVTDVGEAVMTPLDTHALAKPLAAA